ncbi:DUF397 domain-containing protein [Nocardiopsis mangrovi]|uniref:DUF397 domain-containing protein n=1 Tax=Nocardiopsis mangrovi TaxID=1179818 RepID=A0ABV9E0Z3_9ACTN
MVCAQRGDHVLNETWTKSSWSNAGGSCVEARTDGATRVQMRDTLNRTLGTLTFPRREWTALLSDIDAL